MVTLRSAETIDDCLQRLRAADGVAAIRVVDNASDDGTLEIVQRHALADARVRFIANPDNPGFAVACNQGATRLPTATPRGWPSSIPTAWSKPTRWRACARMPTR